LKPRRTRAFVALVRSTPKGKASCHAAPPAALARRRAIPERASVSRQLHWSARIASPERPLTTVWSCRPLVPHQLQVSRAAMPGLDSFPGKSRRASSAAAAQTGFVMPLPSEADAESCQQHCVGPVGAERYRNGSAMLDVFCRNEMDSDGKVQEQPPIRRHFDTRLAH